MAVVPGSFLRVGQGLVGVLDLLEFEVGLVRPARTTQGQCQQQEWAAAVAGGAATRDAVEQRFCRGAAFTAEEPPLAVFVWVPFTGSQPVGNFQLVLGRCARNFEHLAMKNARLNPLTAWVFESSPPRSSIALMPSVARLLPF